MNHKNEGRQKGYIVSDETKKKQSDSFRGKFRVQTPQGVFESAGDAAKAHHCTVSHINYCIDTGLKQREYLRRTEGKWNPKDYTKYFKLGKRGQTRGREVRTPMGDFLTVAACAKALNITSAGVLTRIRRWPDDYRYLT